MSGSIVTIRINGNPYQLGCDKGQEAEIEQLGKMVDEMVSNLAQSVGQIGESRLLVMAAILLAEKVAAADGGAGALSSSTPAHLPVNEDELIQDEQIETLEKLAQTISALAASIKSA